MQLQVYLLRSANASLKLFHICGDKFSFEGLSRSRYKKAFKTKKSVKVFKNKFILGSG